MVYHHDKANNINGLLWILHRKTPIPACIKVVSAQYLQGDSRNDTRNACEYWVFAVPYFGHDIMYPIVSGNPAPDGRRLDRADIILEVSRGPKSEGMG